MQKEYKINLESYNGPLDLLLYLIRREEVDIYDIPIASITEQYLVYLNEFQKVDISLAGDFLMMASTLMYIKSQTLLPRNEIVENEEEEEDPRLELVKQLLEYKRYKEAATTMSKLSEERSKEYSRPKTCLPVRCLSAEQAGTQTGSERSEFKRLLNEEEANPARSAGGEEQLCLEEIDVWKLAQFFSIFMKQTLADAGTTVVYDDTPVHIYMDKVINSLVNTCVVSDASRPTQRVISFNELFFINRRHVVSESKLKTEIIGFFLALLELVRLNKVRLEQLQDFEEIRIISNRN